MSIDIWYSQGHPAGYTDDLGIIADRDQWIDVELPGWYAAATKDFSMQEVVEWCQSNLEDTWDITHGKIRMSALRDAFLFRMRWVDG